LRFVVCSLLGMVEIRKFDSCRILAEILSSINRLAPA
jgi:hypothetical protein